MKNKWHRHHIAIVCIALRCFQGKTVILNTRVPHRDMHALHESGMWTCPLRFKDEDLHGAAIHFDGFNTMGHDSLFQFPNKIRSVVTVPNMYLT